MTRSSYYKSGKSFNRRNNLIYISGHQTKKAPSLSSLPNLFVSNSRSLISKIDELSATVKSYTSDIVVVTETWLSSNVPNSAINLCGYSLLRHDRSDGRRGGGVCVFVKDTLPFIHLKEIESHEYESLWILLKPHRLPRGLNSIVLGIVYHPPGSDDKALLSHLTESIDSVLSTNPGAGIILAGDFNQFKHRQLCSSFNLKQLVKDATRGKNILDKIFTNISKFYNPALVISPIGHSDHNSIVLKPLPANSYGGTRSTRLVRDSRLTNRRIVSDHLSKVNWLPLYHMESCDKQFQYFSTIVDNIIKEHLPWKQIKIDSSDKPWITSEIESLISKRQTAWAAGNNLMFRFYRNRVNALCKKARLNCYNKSIAGVQQSDSRKWWSAVKNIAGLQSSKNVSTMMFQGKSYSDADLANLLNDKFVAVGSSLPNLNWLPLPTNDIPDDFCISVEETEKALLSSKLHSSAGPDEIPSWLLRENASVLCRPLCSIFNSSVREGFVPSIWKAANITPVQKSSPPIDVDSDFRPISLTPIISKILESFPYKWLLDSVSKKIDSLQFGSLKGSSTSMALIYMLHKWFEAADKQGNTIRICLLDFSKAFDRLDHNILLEKLKDMEVHPVLLNWIANFLTGRQQRTRVGQFFSEWKFLNAGVPQGTKLGPLLFLIMINDLAVVDETVKFVDDTSLWEIISNNSPSQLPANISCSEWSSDNNMKLNVSKTKELRVCFSKLTPSFAPITICGQEVDVVSEAKLLGVVLSDDLKWNCHIDYICKKAAKRLYCLRLLKRSALPSHILISTYCTHIRPIVEYACQVWHYGLPHYLSEQVEKIQKRALKIIFPGTTYAECLLTANLMTLYERRTVLCKRLFSKMLEPTHKLNALVPPKSLQTYNLRSYPTLLVPKCRTERFSNSFIPAASRAYNNT